MISFEVTKGFVGALMIGHAVPGYLITTSDFHVNAHLAADEVNANKVTPDLVSLINGAYFERYIAYVGGSRLAGEYAGTPIAPLEPIRPNIIAEGDQLADSHPLGPDRAHILVLANNKGGVAKTTTALNLAFDLSREHTQGQGRAKVITPGSRVLLIDMDGQASLTASLPAPGPEEDSVPEDNNHLARYFRGQAALAHLIRPTRFPNILVIPAHSDLHLLDTGGGARPSAELRFVHDLLTLAHSTDSAGNKRLDWIILDTPPAQSFFTRLALAAADHVVIPAQAETYAMRGINRLSATLKTMHALTGALESWKQTILGCVVTRWRAGAGAESALAQLVLDLPLAGIRRFEDVIPFDDKIEQAIVNEVRGGLGNIFRLAKQPGPAARAYVQLTEKVVERAN